MAISPFAYPKLPRKKSVFNYLRHADIARNGARFGHGSSPISTGKSLRMDKTEARARNTEPLAATQRRQALIFIERRR